MTVSFAAFKNTPHTHWAGSISTPAYLITDYRAGGKAGLK